MTTISKIMAATSTESVSSVPHQKRSYNLA
jgi:hypothetical protein